MATATQRSDFRLDLGLDADGTVVFTDSAIDRLFERAGDKHSTPADLKFAYAKVLGVRQLQAKAFSYTDYEQNDSSEKLQQVFKNLTQLEKRVTAEYAAALSSAKPSMRVARSRTKPARKVEYPDA